MAKMKTQGLSTFQNQLDLLAKEIHNMNKVALYDAAGMVADEIKKGLQSMPTRPMFPIGTDEKPITGATISEKEQIIDNFGISTFVDSAGSVSTSIGFTGYVNTPSNRFDDHVPTGFLMQAIEYGTSFRQPTHTVTKATRGLKQKVQNKIDQSLSEQIEKL